MINLLQLRVFQAVAQTSSFTRAADVVHPTQPGISKHIKQMEESFGTPLFDRSGRKATLTEAGAILFEATQRVMANRCGRTANREPERSAWWQTAARNELPHRRLSAPAGTGTIPQEIPCN